MRTLVGVLLVALVLVPLAALAVRGVRRVVGPMDADEAGRTTLQNLAEGLIVLAALIVGVVLVVAVAD
ncbi:MAG TPA: hypothetical protein VJM07_06850 [Gaiella sp.]|nr:hypothetical protein [Gaiella sp.]